MLLSAEYLYFDNDLLQEVLYGNGTRTVYLYDAADRLQVIEHQSPMGDTILSMVYDLDARGLITKVTESDEVGVLAGFQVIGDMWMVGTARYAVLLQTDVARSIELNLP